MSCTPGKLQHRIAFDGANRFPYLHSFRYASEWKESLCTVRTDRTKQNAKKIGDSKSRCRIREACHHLACVCVLLNCALVPRAQSRSTHIHTPRRRGATDRHWVGYVQSAWPSSGTIRANGAGRRIQKHLLTQLTGLGVDGDAVDTYLAKGAKHIPRCGKALEKTSLR